MERKLLRQFYGKQSKPAEDRYQEGIVTNSLERLIDRGLAIGYGRRTPCKWFITHIKLTKQGIKKAIEILESKQRKLPL